MQERSNWTILFKPSSGDGQRITIGPVSQRSVALDSDDYNKEHHIWCTKACWIRIGTSTVTAVAPAGGGAVLSNGDFPLSAGSVYTYIPTGDSNSYIAVIEDASVTGVTGYLFIGRSEF